MITSNQILEKGTVLKIDSLIYLGQDYHNYWGVVIGYDTKTKKYRVQIEVQENVWAIVWLPNKNIKWLIGTETEDIYGLGEKRHKKDVVSLIEKVKKLNWTDWGLPISN